MKRIKTSSIRDHEFAIINKIVDRARLFFPDRKPMDIRMDIVATVSGGCPLLLQHWLDAPDLDFVHDVVGIERHLNRRTFCLENAFVPRFADIKRMETT